MKRKKMFYLVVISSFFVMTSSGNVYSGTVTMQREGDLQNNQESAAAKNDVNVDSHQLKFAPLGLNNKNDSVMEESEDGKHSVKMERYKPDREAQGESKTK